MKPKHYKVLLVVLALMVSIVPAVSVGAQADIESVCLVTDLGQVTDGGFNQFAHEGAESAADDLGLDYDYIETQAQTDYGKNIQTCLDDGYDVIVTVGFLIADGTRQAAIDNPDVYFVGVDQFVGPDAEGNAAPTNYVGLQFREDQAGFLAGALAAQMTALGDRAAAEGEQEVIGGVYGPDVPAVKKFRFGFENGAKFINPDINVLGAYVVGTQPFNDPVAGGQAANQEIGDGADVIFGAGGPTGNGAIQEAAQQGVLVIGVDQDQYFTVFQSGETPGAENIISSAIKRVDSAVYLGIESLINGDFPGGSNLVLSAENDGVGLAPGHDADVPDEVLATIDNILEGLKNGTIVTGVDPVSGDPLPNLGTALESAGLTGLIAAIDGAGMTETMGEFPAGLGVTLFAPTDEALAAVGELSAEALSTTLGNHSVLGAYSSSHLAAAGTVTTFGGTELVVTVAEDGTVWLNETIQVVTSDILFDHGVIHVIDTVIPAPAA
jgi:basic membrane lipoprotein Med (substrate-binding protein (PBP1-ABC) superfamily)